MEKKLTAAQARTRLNEEIKDLRKDQEELKILLPKALEDKKLPKVLKAYMKRSVELNEMILNSLEAFSR